MTQPGRLSYVVEAGEVWSRRRRGALRAKREVRARSPARGVLAPERPDRSGHRAAKPRLESVEKVLTTVKAREVGWPRRERHG